MYSSLTFHSMIKQQGHTVSVVITLPALTRTVTCSHVFFAKVFSSSIFSSLVQKHQSEHSSFRFLFFKHKGPALWLNQSLQHCCSNLLRVIRTKKRLFRLQVFHSPCIRMLIYNLMDVYTVKSLRKSCP